MISIITGDGLNTSLNVLSTGGYALSGRPAQSDGVAGDVIVRPRGMKRRAVTSVPSERVSDAQRQWVRQKRSEVAVFTDSLCVSFL
jgi:hypothetical protein